MGLDLFWRELGLGIGDKHQLASAGSKRIGRTTTGAATAYCTEIIAARPIVNVAT